MRRLRKGIVAVSLVVLLPACSPEGACVDSATASCSSPVKATACPAPRTFRSRSTCPAEGYADNGGGGDLYVRFDLVPHRNEALGFSLAEPRGLSRDESTGVKTFEAFRWTFSLGASPSAPDRSRMTLSCSITTYARTDTMSATLLDRSRRVSSTLSEAPHGFIDVHPIAAVPGLMQVERVYEGSMRTGTADCSGPASKLSDIKSMLDTFVVD